MSHPSIEALGAGSREDFEADVVLRDGSTVRVRAVRPADEPRLLEFLRGLSESSRTLRFGGGVSDYFLRQAAGQLAREDSEHALGLIAMSGPDQRIIGHAMYAVIGPDHAEVAFAIADTCQHQGLGTILLGELAQVASSRGIRVFEAIVLPRNHQMVAVFRESGFPVQIHAAPDEILVEFPTEFTEEALEHFEQREWTAAVNAIHAFFHPRSVAVMGASRRRGTIGGEAFHNLVSYGFRGPVFPVNPAAPVVQGVVAYPSVEDIPGPVDLAVVVVPAERVPGVVEACGRKGVRALVVLSAGFAETGAEGRARQQELVATARAAGMRLIGPNCMGVLNTDPEVRLNATFAPAPPPQGRIALHVAERSARARHHGLRWRLGVGLSTFVSVGNKADISGNDLLRYWEQDPSTDVILLYLESFGNPRKFSRIARRVAREKPIVAVKSGRSLAGSRAAGSHTGALLAAADVTVDALFRHPRRDPYRHTRGDVRCRVAAREPAAPQGTSRRDPHQRRRAWDSLRRCLRGRGARDPVARRDDPGGTPSVAASRGERRKPGRHDRVRDCRPVSRRDPDRGVRSQRGRAGRHLHPAPGHPAGRCSSRHRGWRSRVRRAKAGAHGLHAVAGSAGRAACRGAAGSVVRVSGGCSDCAGASRTVRRMAGTATPASGQFGDVATG